MRPLHWLILLASLFGACGPLTTGHHPFPSCHDAGEMTPPIVVDD